MCERECVNECASVLTHSKSKYGRSQLQCSSLTSHHVTYFEVCVCLTPIVLQLVRVTSWPASLRAHEGQQSPLGTRWEVKLASVVEAKAEFCVVQPSTQGEVAVAGKRRGVHLEHCVPVRAEYKVR